MTRRPERIFSSEASDNDESIDIYERARQFFPEKMVKPEEMEAYWRLLERLRAGEVIEPGDADVPKAYWGNAERMVGQHAYSELVGMQPEGEFLGRAPSLERERDLIAKVTDEAGHCIYYLNAFQGSRVQALEDLYQEKMRYSVVFDDSPSLEGGWAGITGIQLCVDGGAVINQTSLTGTSWGPYARANLQVTREEGMHVALGEETAQALIQGTPDQQEMLAEALRFWWSRGLMVNGPSDSGGPWALFSLQSGLKVLSNDEAHQKYAARFYHVPQSLGVDVGDPLEIDEEEFRQFLNYGGPLHAERMRVREQAFREGAWVREAIASRTGETEPPVYEIFQQEGEAEPFASMGSIMGTDELAPVLAARAFGRRPHAADTTRLTLARQNKVLKLTRRGNKDNTFIPTDGPGEYAVFIKKDTQNNYHFVEFEQIIKAESPTDALEQVLDQEPELTAVWLTKTDNLIELPEDQVETIFRPAANRQFLVSGMRGHFNRRGEFKPPRFSPYPLVSHEGESQLDPNHKEPLKNWLTAFADDHLLNAQRLSEWLGRSPLPEADLDLGYHVMHAHTHAAALYELAYLANGKQPEDQPNQAVYFRNADQFRSAQITELEHSDWAEIMVKQLLLKTFEILQLDTLQNSAYQPLAETARTLLTEAQGDLISAKAWSELLATETTEGKERFQQALNKLWPYSEQLFSAIDSQQDQALIEAGLIPDPSTLRTAWQKAITKLLNQLELTTPINQSTPLDRSNHTPQFTDLIAYRQSTARSQPADAQW